MLYHHILLFLHILGACVLFGTGAGIAFFMLWSHKSQNPIWIAHTASIVVVADTIFTATAAIVQPITGTLLAFNAGWSLTEPWILISIGLYVFIGMFWLPVVWIQIQLRNLAKEAADHQQPLSASYHRLYRYWFAFGWPAFLAILGILWLMITKPSF